MRIEVGSLPTRPAIFFMSNKYEYVKKSIEKRREWVYELKSNPCTGCGNKYHPCAMHFHHIDSKTKSFEIGKQSYRKSREKIQKEIDKCVLLCANCHSFLHYNESH